MTLSFDDGLRAAPILNKGIVPADTLRLFPDLVQILGADAAPLCQKAGIDPGHLGMHNAAIRLESACRLLDEARLRLACPDFGMRLAAFQRGAKMSNLFELVMRNAPTVGDALTYCAGHVQTYSGSVSMNLEPVGSDRRTFVRYEIIEPTHADQGQALEHMLLRTSFITADISGGRVRPGEIWFAHEACAPPAVYRKHFGCPVYFGQRASGFYLHEAELRIETVAPDPQVYELATFFIEHKLRQRIQPTTARVNALIARLLHTAQDCTSEEIAGRLGLHRRTMQRRLREEGSCFETLKDEVRREMALRCLRQSDMPLSRLAEKLGYSEVSALSRSCNRWFATSPRKLRKGLAGPAA